MVIFGNKAAFSRIAYGVDLAAIHEPSDVFNRPVQSIPNIMCGNDQLRVQLVLDAKHHIVDKNGLEARIDRILDNSGAVVLERAWNR